MVNEIELVLLILISAASFLSIGTGIAFGTANDMNNTGDNNPTVVNATNSTITANVTGGDTVTIPILPKDTNNKLFLN